MTYYDAEIEYLESTGTLYINTGIKPNQDTRIFTTMKCVTSNNYGRLFGAGMYNAANSIMIDYENGATGTLHVKYGPKKAWTQVSSVKGDYNIHTYDYNKNEVYRDGVKVSENTYTAFQCIANLGIFTYINNSNNPGAATEFFKGRCYNFKIYDNNVLIRDFIPVRIGTTGYLYDKVLDRLFGNAGTGSFTLGPDVAGWPGVTGKPKVSSIRRLMILLMPRIDYSKLYAIHKKINPAAMAVVYAQGWSASPDYMTFEEAAAVTNITNKFYNNKQLTHFEEFKYFTGVTAFSESLSYYWFRNCTNLSTIELPNSLRILGYNCFNSSGLTSIYLPDTITQINQGRANWHNGGTFASCTKLKTVRYTGGVTYIRSHCFYNCTKLEEITNIDNVTAIGGDAFRNCSSLVTFTIPSKVTSIGASNASITGSFTDYTFAGCTALTNIICLPTTPPVLTGTNNFLNTTCTISVPAESLEVYKAAPGWSDVADRIIAIT